MRDRIEVVLGLWGIYVGAHPWRVIFGMLLATGLLAPQIQHFYLETSNDAFFHSSSWIIRCPTCNRQPFAGRGYTHFTVYGSRVVGMNT